MAEVFQTVLLKKGVIPLVEGQAPQDSFYIIKQGSVKQTNSFMSHIAQENRTLGVGDFFGVVDCMARRPNLYTIEALEDTTLIQIRRDQFDVLIQQNTPIAMKILRFFSQKLRLYDGILTLISGQKQIFEDPVHLYDLAYFYENKMRDYKAAIYGYVRYCQQCPSGTKIAQAKEAILRLYKKHGKQIEFHEPDVKDFYVTFEDKDVIFLEHEIGNNLYIIQNGEVKILKVVNNQEILLNVLKTGDIFGEMAILENKPRNASAIASGRVLLMSISRENFGSLVEKHPQIATKIITLLSDRIWFLQRHIFTMMITDYETRLYDALYIQALKSRIDIAPKVRYTFPLTFEDLLKFTALNNPEGYRTLQSILSNKTLFDLENNKIVCKDVSQLPRPRNLLLRYLDRDLQQKLGSMFSENPAH